MEMCIRDRNNDVHNQGMGFSGYISEDAFQKAYIDKTPITDENGVEDVYKRQVLCHGMKSRCYCRLLFTERMSPHT